MILYVGDCDVKPPPWTNIPMGRPVMPEAVDGAKMSIAIQSSLPVYGGFPIIAAIPSIQGQGFSTVV
jgi:hypothetical protein